MIELVSRCEADANLGPVQFWNLQAIKSALDILKNLRDENKKPRYVRAYLVVRRDRNLTQPRRETQGIIDSAEYALAPVDSPTLFLYRQNPTSKGEPAVWWPQLRFPVGNYVLAFSFDW